MRTEYIDAERLLAQAEAIARGASDWDTLARLYMPLQEARRQRRQLCGEGLVVLDLIARGAGEDLRGEEIVGRYKHGQLLIAGWGSIGPAIEARRIIGEKGLYAETFLAATYPVTGGGIAVAVVPTEDVALPSAEIRSVDALARVLPSHSVLISAGELPRGERRGNSQTYAEMMGMWERLHLPFLAAADMQVDPVQKVEGYRKTIRVDYACELAHQNLSNVAHELAKAARRK